MSKDSRPYHVPVLLNEVLEALAIRPDGLYMDGTCGGGGHSAAILERLDKDGCLLASDRDQEALEVTWARLSAMNAPARFCVENYAFSELDAYLRAKGASGADGILLDLGVSSHQLDEAERGFSYQQAGPLDMRMDGTEGKSLLEFLHQWSHADLTHILKVYGEERYAGRIARVILEGVEAGRLKTTLDLAECIKRVMPGKSKRDKHPAKRSFQALRIAVNGELEQLEAFLDKAVSLLKVGGRLCIISFHSLEDRLVKTRLRSFENPCHCDLHFPCVCGKSPLGKVLSRKGYACTEAEAKENLRARSARLRVFERGEGPLWP